MDEEDIKEFKAHTIAATSDYDISKSQAKHELEKDFLTTFLVNEKGGIMGDLASKIVSDWIVPTSDSIGIRLLRAMGWREGQGVGPRTKRRADIHSKDYSFAPKDVGLVSTKGKKDTFGLGYEAFKNAPEFTPSNVDFEKKMNTGFGIGIGIFEEEDDEMVYDSPGPMYEAVIKEDEHEDRIYLGKDKKFQGKSASKSISKFCRDAKPPLPGFVLANSALLESKWYYFRVFYNIPNVIGSLLLLFRQILNHLPSL